LTTKVNNDFSISCSHYYDDLGVFERHTTGIGSKFMKKMGYEGKFLGVNGQSTVNPSRCWNYLNMQD